MELEKEIDKINTEINVLVSKIQKLDNSNENTENNVNTLRQETERCMSIVSEFHEHTLAYLHYLESKIDKISDIRPILIIGNKERKDDESDIS